MSKNAKIGIGVLALLVLLAILFTMDRKAEAPSGGTDTSDQSLREDAAAYKNRVVQEAEGEAARFVSVYNEYARAPEVTRKRLFLETMEQVLGDSQKVMIETGAGASGVLPYLPLPELRPNPGASTTTTTGN